MSKKIKSWKEIPLTETAKAKLAGLPTGVTLALRMRHVNSSDPNLPKVQIEFAEKINNGTQNAASLLNANDDRFSSGAQRCWETADLAVAEKMFGKIPEGEASVEILKELESKFRIQLTECLESELTDEQKNYKDNYLKRAGADGNFFYAANGERVASRKRLVIVEPGTNPENTYISGSYKSEPGSTGNVMTGSKPALHSDVMGD